MSRTFIYVHDGYGNEPYILQESAIQGEWQSLQALGGEWSEIGELTDRGSAYLNEAGEEVYVEATTEVLSAYPIKTLAKMNGIRLVTLPLARAAAIADEIEPGIGMP